MRPMPSLLALLLPLAALAQAPATLEREPAGEPRKNQKIERIHTEDGGNTIEEVRVGGQVQSVTVQPKAAVPAYELQPSDLARSRPGDSRDGLADRKQRVWNLFGF
ncbi:MAG TPA: hypothetical protein VFB71_07645 [Ramlibacter sp.]|nr:hypothetical protein [Ramlibacter sp.]